MRNSRNSMLWLLAVATLALLPADRTALANAKAGTGSIVGEVTATPARFRAGVVVHLGKVAGKAKAPSTPAELDQKGLRFVPRVLAVTVGSTVKFVNSDNVAHNVFSPDGEKYDLGSWGKGAAMTHTFNKPGAYTQLCRIHPEMIAYIVVVDSPYFAVTDANGKFHIDGVPPGTYTVHTWSERLPEATQSVTVKAGGSANVNLELKR